MGLRLLVAAGTRAGAELAFDEAPVAIGRSSRCEVVVSDLAVSRRHARIIRDRDSYWIEDLRSANGTKLNGAPVERARLADGDELVVGSARFRFVGGLAETTDRTSPDGLTHIPARSAAVGPRPEAAYSVRGFALGVATVRRVIVTANVLWSRASLKAKALIVSCGAIAVLGLIGAAAHRALAPPARIASEPTVLSGTPIEESFGLGAGVRYSHHDAKVFDFEFHAPGRAVVVLHFQSRDISEGEVIVTVNAVSVGTVPADLLEVEQVAHEIVVPPELLRKGRNRIAFESTRNPPQRDAWRVWNIWVETNALPEMTPDQLLREASAIFERAEQNFARREVAASNRYSAWKEYRSAWLTLQALPDPKPELYLRAQDRMRDAQRELDRICAALMLHVQRAYNLKDWASARDALEEVKSYFPGTDQPCPWKAEQRRVELKL